MDKGLRTHSIICQTHVTNVNKFKHKKIIFTVIIIARGSHLGVHRDQPRTGISGDPGTFSPGRRDRDFRILSRRPGPGPGFKIKPVHHSLKSIVCRFWMQMSILIDITLILSTEHLLLTHNLFLPVFYPLDLATFSRNQTPFTKSTRHSYYK